MRLRERLAVNTLIATAVLLPVIWLANDRLLRFDTEQTIGDAISSAMAGDGRARCEAAPARFGGGELQFSPATYLLRTGEPPRPQLWAYDEHYRSANGAAPPFPHDLARTLTDTIDRAAGDFPIASDTGRHLAVRMPWRSGPCAILVGRFGPWVMPQGPRVAGLLALGLSIIIAALVSTIPTISRIRRLSTAVGAADLSSYALGVPMSGPDEIGDFERAFNRAGDRIRDYVASVGVREAELRATVSSTSHDVALPLTVLQGHLSRMHAQIAPGDRAHDGLRAAIRETHHLAALLHNLGTAARLDVPMPVIERQPLDIKAPIERVVARHLQLADTLGIELVAAMPPSPVLVNMDITLVEQAVANLVHNALRSFRPGGHVGVVLEALDAERLFSVRVLDDGPPDATAEALVASHDGGDVSVDGVGHGRQGLPMRIVRLVAEHHGFSLHQRESEYGGAEFEIVGPCEANVAELSYSHQG